MNQPTPTDKANALLAGHRSALVEMIEANDAAHVDRVGRFILDGLSRRARTFIRKIDAEFRYGTEGTDAGMWGKNGYAPYIRNIIEASEFHRKAIGEVVDVMEAAE